MKTSHKLPGYQGPSVPRAKAHSILILESEKTEADAGKVTQQVKEGPCHISLTTNFHPQDPSEVGRKNRDS